MGALLPHAVEHLAIELMVRQFPGQAFAGNTVWVNQTDQIMRVRLSLPRGGQEEAAAGALQEAIRQLNQLLALA